MIILRKQYQREFSVIGNFAMSAKSAVLNGAVKGSNMINNRLTNLNNIALNPGKAFNKKIENTIRKPISESIKTVETIGDASGVVPSVPGMSFSKLGKVAENKMKKGTRIGLALKADKYKKSSFAKNLESGVNAVYNSGRAMIGLPMI